MANSHSTGAPAPSVNLPKIPAASPERLSTGEQITTGLRWVSTLLEVIVDLSADSPQVQGLAEIALDTALDCRDLLEELRREVGLDAASKVVDLMRDLDRDTKQAAASKQVRD